jgi:hypothetical protein
MYCSVERRVAKAARFVFAACFGAFLIRSRSHMGVA